jgi:hypothetical protein
MADWPKLTHLDYNHDAGVLTVHREDGEWVAFQCLLKQATDLRGLLGVPLRERKNGAWMVHQQPDFIPQDLVDAITPPNPYWPPSRP